ncbi:CrcB family protein [Paracoccus liaowanqingii]|uniref:Fluoride-specific ion channel FluC n=1 Tax=Paracoccus liaowanqingii TaxID=2560053 RepID=A0A4Z1CSW5_9RHOB|nr:CrcB family protein [Paracoccus liaowanqingii]TGN68442.1 CrcB family protein [Paracoccus liaowanqingii]
MNPFLQVAIGGALGSVCRYGIYRLVPPHWASVGLATGLVNVLGSFAMGLLAALLAHRLGHAWAPLLLTGLLGGFTTFSAFSLDTLAMWERGQGMIALTYVAGSVLLSLAAVMAGLALGRGIWA